MVASENLAPSSLALASSLRPGRVEATNMSVARVLFGEAPLRRFPRSATWPVEDSELAQPTRAMQSITTGAARPRVQATADRPLHAEIEARMPLTFASHKHLRTLGAARKERSHRAPQGDSRM